MKFISWNVNGLRAAVKHDFMTTFNDLDADFFCVQETKMQPDQLTLELPGYHQYFNSAERKGYSGTAIFTKHQPLNVTYDIGTDEFDHEGRVITLEYTDFFLVTCYTPNSGTGLKRLDFRMGWEKAFQDYIDQLNEKKPVILCGDLNVAHEEIDIKNPKTNHKNAGFTDQERKPSRTSLPVATPTRSGTSIRTPLNATLGGAIGSAPAIVMQVGASTISLPATPYNQN